MYKSFGQALVATVHINKRVSQRISNNYRAHVALTLQRCIQAINLKKVPSCDWNMPIYSGSKHIGYICGSCNEVSTVFSANMKPKGRTLEV